MKLYIYRFFGGPVYACDCEYRWAYGPVQYLSKDGLRDRYPVYFDTVAEAEAAVRKAGHEPCRQNAGHEPVDKTQDTVTEKP